MAARTMVHGGRDTRHDAFASTNLSYRPQTASPTLTNPDMILPDYDEPEHVDGRSHPLSGPWHNAHPPRDLDGFSQPGYVPGPLAPTTPIIYGNGTMLSDIGEVTEVESTAGHPPSRNSSGFSGTPGTGSGTPVRSSPTIGERSPKKKPHAAKRERRLSSESTSTIQTIDDGPLAAFRDFDDSVSVDDSNFQGDDEESLASEYVDETSVHPPSAAVMLPGHGLNEHRLSSNSISKRAEQILANAKHRLLTMEGNLNSARTFSYSTLSECSTPSPGPRPNSSTHEKFQTNTSSHSRNVSENGLQGSARKAVLPQRSASALGAAGGYRQHLTPSRGTDGSQWRLGPSSLKSSLTSIDSALERLDEDGSQRDEDHHRPCSQVAALGSPTFGLPTQVGMTRSPSAAQVRDLQGQMQGLKGKISSLRQQAQADSMKRRSLQSIRAPSPFTHARWDQGYTSPKQSDTPETGSPDSANRLNGTKPGFKNDKSPEEVGEEESEAQLKGDVEAGSLPGVFQKGDETQDTVHFQAARSADEAALNGEPKASRRIDYEQDKSHPQNDRVTENDQEDRGVEEFADYGSESGESLYHDTHQEPTDISHEDREDAFDYEHFFLHSAMGTLSRQRMSRSDSVGSEGSQDSVETTRGPAAKPARRPSIDTLASVDSFATAMEGRESRSTVSRSARSGDGFVTPAANHEDGDSSSITTKRSTFGRSSHDSPSGGGSGSGSGSDSAEYYRKHARYSSVIYRPISASTTSTLHRPSVSSFESTGTNRSFPLVNKARLSQGTLTPSESPDNQLKQVAESLMNETRSICDQDSAGAGSGPQSPAIQTLSREDQMLVEQVVTSLGRCVLGLSEASRLGTGNHDEYRERIEAARKLLENIEYTHRQAFPFPPKGVENRAPRPATHSPPSPFSGSSSSKQVQQKTEENVGMHASLTSRLLTELLPPEVAVSVRTHLLDPRALASLGPVVQPLADRTAAAVADNQGVTGLVALLCAVTAVVVVMNWIRRLILWWARLVARVVFWSAAAALLAWVCNRGVVESLRDAAVVGGRVAGYLAVLKDFWWQEYERYEAREGRAAARGR
ncbi:uncharacterized protein MAM_02038 [Metarhizium album ARSEF 1941]|uniref:Uncharacterized protein n=1 Tax=Metarhizium album (strain ARSEF 1941) TaxID=1081103 RepID=A0A0B2X3V8_METAS|nr:uncharacterized protein MAM_02038 [Metarhizium album ARSEF 1941]KHO00115.1 hypothetical protein MAM_02038 [Metarhizium album ARSEF 1941]